MNIDYNFPSPNYSIRERVINFIIIHYTELTFEEALNRLRDPLIKVSAHYLIKEDGEIFSLVNDQYSAWHAGSSCWHNTERLNENSIGIELDNLGTGDFALKQMESCIDLCTELMNKYGISPINVIGHSDIAPERKIDPGIFFDWSYLAKHNIGIWHNTNISQELNDIYELFKFGDAGLEIMLLQTSLKKIGYKIEISKVFDQQTNFVVRAFQAHFYPQKILKFGLDFYRDPSSKYSWDNISAKILSNLIEMLKTNNKINLFD
jgi:N-acetylmuramoyl-L-alanine amidase